MIGKTQLSATNKMELRPRPWPLVVSSAKLPRTGLGVITNEDLCCCYICGPFQGRFFGEK